MHISILVGAEATRRAVKVRNPANTIEKEKEKDDDVTARVETASLLATGGTSFRGVGGSIASAI